jgi:hypothetical protein
VSAILSESLRDMYFVHRCIFFCVANEGRHRSKLTNEQEQL